MTVVLGGLITAVGIGFTVTVAVAVELPQELVTVTVYVVVPVTVGVTEMEEAVCPLFHKYVPPPDALSVALFPRQMVVLPLTEAVGGKLTVTVIVVVLEQPLASVPVTV
jgi:hypothetical protein